MLFIIPKCNEGLVKHLAIVIPPARLGFATTLVLNYLHGFGEAAIRN